MSLHDQQQIVTIDPPAWRKLFKRKSEMNSIPMAYPISDFLPAGITFIGGLPDAGKTLFCLSMAKAITTGQKFLGQFEVNEPSSVLYLIPEIGEEGFRAAMDKMRIADDELFLCRTMADEPIGLTDLRLIEAVRDRKPIVFLDSLIRFNPSQDEDSAGQSKLLGDAIHALIRAGAKAVVCVHHSPKGSGQDSPTLENTLRGSGDFGAMADAVYCLRVKDKDSLKVRVKNVKARHSKQVPPFLIQGRPFIDDTGDFGIIEGLKEPKAPGQDGDRVQQFISAVKAKPDASFSELEAQLNLTRGTLQRLAEGLGWSKEGGVTWLEIRSKAEGAQTA